MVLGAEVFPEHKVPASAADTATKNRKKVRFLSVVQRSDRHRLLGPPMAPPGTREGEQPGVGAYPTYGRLRRLGAPPVLRSADHPVD